MLADMPESPEPRGNKRSSSSLSSGDENKKARGRPRVEPQDETAADRRRTQIRLAQRTYRQRKESTITTLQTKVSQLETIIHEMHSSFQGVKQDALTSKVGEFDPALSRRLADAAKKFEELARDAKINKRSSRSHSDDWGSDDANEEIKSPKRLRTDKLATKGNRQKDQKTAKAPQPTIVSTEQRGIPSVWGYETIIDGLPGVEEPETIKINELEELYPPVTQSLFGSNSSIMGYFDQPSGLMTPYDGIDFSAPMIPDMQLPLPPSIAHEETTFSRRLHRTVLEAAVRLLNDPRPDPKKLEMKFGHVMRYASQADIAKRLYLRLLRSKYEPLESNFNYPPITYYGPYSHQEWKIPAEYHAQIDFLTHEDNQGDGAWYAPDDVQTYLERRGVHIDPKDSLVECEINLMASPTRPDWYSPAASNNGDGLFYGTPTSLDSANFDLTGASSLAPGQQVELQNDLLGPYGSYTSAKTITPPNDSEKGLERIQKRVTVDVTKLIGELIKAAVCLGRSPGFRRRDVERAFQNSIKEVVAY